MAVYPIHVSAMLFIHQVLNIAAERVVAYVAYIVENTINLSFKF
jgi:hypothetical protein